MQGKKLLATEDKVTNKFFFTRCKKLNYCYPVQVKRTET